MLNIKKQLYENIRMKRGLFNIKGIKEEFEKKGFKIGRRTIIEFFKLEEDKIKEDIKSAVRKARLSGRKIIRPEDFKEV